MMIVPKFWQLLEARGYRVEDARPRLDPNLERVIEEELVAEEMHGEREPDAVPDLPGNVRLIRKGRLPILIYAAESTFEKGLWGVGVDAIAALSRQPLRWALVLFHGDGKHGYWVEGERVAGASAKWKRIIPDGPHYELREPEQTAGEGAFESTEELLLLIDRLLT